MPKKRKVEKKVEATVQTDEELTEEVKAALFEPKPKEEKKPIVEELELEKPSDTVKLKVLVGTLQFEDGVFQRGDVFTVSKERVKQFDPKDIEIVK